MKKIAFIISTVAIVLSACSTHRNATMANSLLVGKWQQQNITLDLKANGRYTYFYKEGGYGNQQSGNYFANNDSVILYGFYPQAYTAESRNLRWSIRKLTADSLVVYVHKPTVVLDGDTLNTIGDITESFTRK